MSSAVHIPVLHDCSVRNKVSPGIFYDFESRNSKPLSLSSRVMERTLDYLFLNFYKCDCIGQLPPFCGMLISTLLSMSGNSDEGFAYADVIREICSDGILKERY